MATDTEGRASIPRMRTAAKIVAEIKAADPGTEVTEYYIRQLVKEGSVPVVWAGNKALINLDDVLSLLRWGRAGRNRSPMWWAASAGSRSTSQTEKGGEVAPAKKKGPILSQPSKASEYEASKSTRGHSGLYHVPSEKTRRKNVYSENYAKRAQ